MIRASRWVATAAGLLLLIRPAVASASEMDILLKKLVQKGVLTEQEAREVRDEVAREVQQEKQAPLAEEPAAPIVSQEEVKEAVKGLPGGWWLSTVKWSGDLRLRHETQRREPATDRNRERFRLRFGFVARPWDPLEIGVRLATGASGDPVSTNQSFTSTFDKKSVFLDRAYAKYTPWDGLALTGGKMDNPFHTVSETVWDADVTPEGVAVQGWAPGGWAVQPFGNFGVFQVAELSGDAGDPGLFGVQGGAADAGWGAGAICWRGHRVGVGPGTEGAAGGGAADAGGLHSGVRSGDCGSPRPQVVRECAVRGQVAGVPGSGFKPSAGVCPDPGGSDLGGVVPGRAPAAEHTGTVLAGIAGSNRSLSNRSLSAEPDLPPFRTVAHNPTGALHLARLPRNPSGFQAVDLTVSRH